MDDADADRKFGEVLETLLSYGRQGVPFGDERYLQLLEAAEAIIASLPEELRLQMSEYRKVEIKLLRLTANSQVQATSAT